MRSSHRNLASWGGVMLGHGVSAVAATFVFPIFSMQAGLEVFLLNGIDVRRYKIVALKSSSHFRAGFTHLAAAIITADAPGATTLRLDAFPYERIRRTIWPLDADEMPGGYEQYLS